MASIELKALKLLQEAEKKPSTFSYFTSFIWKTKIDYDRIIDCYQRAGNLFKLAKNWPQAAICFTKTAQFNLDNNDRCGAAESYVTASSCFRKCDPQKAINSLLKAIEVFTDMGRFINAARLHQTIAEIYENQLMELESAMQHYEQASDFFRTDGSTAAADGCLVKVAHYSAVMEDYQKAIEIYQQVALTQVGSPNLKYNARDYLFRAALCHLCLDTMSGKCILTRYVELFPMFQETREYHLLNTLIECIDKNKVEEFSKAVIDFDSMSRFEDWSVTMLSRIKKQFTDDATDLR